MISHCYFICENSIVGIDALCEFLVQPVIVVRCLKNEVCVQFTEGCTQRYCGSSNSVCAPIINHMLLLAASSSLGCKLTLAIDNKKISEHEQPAAIANHPHAIKMLSIWHGRPLLLQQSSTCKHIFQLHRQGKQTGLYAPLGL